MKLFGQITGKNKPRKVLQQITSNYLIQSDTFCKGMLKEHKTMLAQMRTMYKVFKGSGIVVKVDNVIKVTTRHITCWFYFEEEGKGESVREAVDCAAHVYLDTEVEAISYVIRKFTKKVKRAETKLLITNKVLDAAILALVKVKGK